MEILETYKHFTIYKKNDHLYFRNNTYINSIPTSLKSAKNRITRYINKLSEREKKQLKYKEYKKDL